jgi:hypothetical protein
LVALQAGINGLYVSVNAAAPNNVWSNATSIGAAQKFTWVVPATGQVQLKCSSNNMFVSSENGTAAMTCNRAAASTWETFTWAVSTKSADDNVISSTNQIGVFPNPAVNEINLINVANEMVTVYNLSGQIVINSFVNEDGKMNVSSLSAGIYYLRADTRTIKILIK